MEFCVHRRFHITYCGVKSGMSTENSNPTRKSQTYHLRPSSFRMVITDIHLYEMFTNGACQQDDNIISSRTTLPTWRTASMLSHALWAIALTGLTNRYVNAEFFWETIRNCLALFRLVLSGKLRAHVGNCHIHPSIHPPTKAQSLSTEIPCIEIFEFLKFFNIWHQQFSAWKENGKFLGLDFSEWRILATAAAAGDGQWRGQREM